MNSSQRAPHPEVLWISSSAEEQSVMVTHSLASEGQRARLSSEPVVYMGIAQPGSLKDACARLFTAAPVNERKTFLRPQA